MCQIVDVEAAAASAPDAAHCALIRIYYFPFYF
jgi:hypothetical protein